MRKTIPTLLALVLAVPLAGPAHAGYEEGVAALKSGDYNTAVRELQGVVEGAPNWAPGYRLLGQALMKAGRNDEAVTQLRKGYDLEPGDPATQLALGQAYVAARRYADAASLLGKIDQSQLPSAQRAALNQMLAVALEKTGQSGNAVAALGKAVAANPNDAKLQYQYGTAALNAGDTSTAVSALAKAVQLAPSETSYRSAYVKSLLRQGRSTRGDAKTAIYRRAAEAAGPLVGASSSYDHLMLLGDAQLGAKQYDSAISSYQKASAKNPADWLPLFYVGQAYTVKEQFRSAEAELKKALDKASSTDDKAKVWKQLGYVYEKQKNYSAATTAYQRAGDPAGVQRVKENEETDRYNREVEAENRAIEEAKQEAEELRQAIQDLPGGTPQ